MAIKDFENNRLSDTVLVFVKDLAALAPIWAVLTLLGYGLLRQLYANFYGTLGASPATWPSRSSVASTGKDGPVSPARPAPTAESSTGDGRRRVPTLLSRFG